MRGTLGYDKWYVHDVGFDTFEASRITNEKDERWYGSAHCLQCAKVEVLTHRGGRVDLRGWHRSQCGTFLWAMQMILEQKEEKEMKR